MMITKIISSAIRKGLRVIKHEPFSGVTKTNELLSDFGVDANPYPGIKGAQQAALTNGRGGIIGFFNRFLFSLSGEHRTYSTLPDGSRQVTEIYQLNDGSILIRAGIEDGSEKYSMLIGADGNVSEAVTAKILTGDMKIEGDLTVDGDIFVGGDIIASGDIVAGGISLKTHTHNYLNGVTPSVTEGPN